MKKMINSTHIEGYLYESNLESKVTGETSKKPGTAYITGTLSIATDEDLTNIVPVHFTYVTATYGNGNKEDPRFNLFSKIISGELKSVMSAGKDAAVKLKIDSAIDLNEFYTDRNGTKELISAKRNEGGFVHVVTQLNPKEEDRNTFKVDMLITNVRVLEEDPEKGTTEKGIIKGCIFNFKNAILPVEFSATNKAAIDYFVGLEASSKQPVFTEIRGRQVSETIVKKLVEESAFGEASVREVTNSRKDWVVNWAKSEPYAWDDESTITAQELKSAIADREVTVASIKKRQEEYEASKAAAKPAKAVAQVNAGDFNF